MSPSVACTVVRELLDLSGLENITFSLELVELYDVDCWRARITFYKSLHGASYCKTYLLTREEVYTSYMTPTELLCLNLRHDWERIVHTLISEFDNSNLEPCIWNFLELS